MDLKGGKGRRGEEKEKGGDSKYFSLLLHCTVCRYLNDIFTLEIREGMSLQWVCPTIEGPCPTPRESHSAIAYGSKLVIFGGMNGRRLGDCWMLDTG